MTVGFTDKKASRRQFLAGAAAAGAGTVAASAASATGGDPLITEIQEWAQATGDGVDATPYGMPIRFEGDVVRRNVEWLTADTISSINFTPIHALDGTITPQGCAFERHHSGAIELAKEDYRLMINGLVDQPLVFTYEDLGTFPTRKSCVFLRMCGEHRYGMGGCAVERCSVHAWYDPQHGIHRYPATHAIERSRRENRG
jgi:sulfane dehydrogenase subunit SoxC